MYQLKPRGTPTFGIFELALAKQLQDDPAALGVVPVGQTLVSWPVMVLR